MNYTNASISSLVELWHDASETERQRIDDMLPKIAQEHGLPYREGMGFKELVEEHDKKLAQEFCAKNPRCLLTFAQQNNLYWANLVFPYTSNEVFIETLEYLISVDNLTLFKPIYKYWEKEPYLYQILNDKASGRKPVFHEKRLHRLAPEGTKIRTYLNRTVKY